ncbi:mediator of RNA polymerase II transcription subunit 26-like isoform X1 [Seriola lalandi dorsalis]|uniref:Mediator of RNA polymerase II transcription subunit 26 n=1 Tax=Seriola lalandi dorsalis TaxID=1841481 RepID=A0A3B4YT30_SERLL|nr:mediator of RNA polymerase II transcription subunit 26-like isoform X1 [Seriola lalandi dorsalis]XP_056233723.1 mediator of RNA polymerase II transcription subunit 26-like isoform X1 [Seriola aureovittata]
MTAATATPQVMRDRLLQAIDGQSNQICNMVVVVEVISFLEKYPITKEALEETRLGKLINDVRKKTKNEDLAKRAKKLLRNWQKLIEPGKDEVLSKGHTGASWSSNGGAHPCISTPAATTPSGKTGPELKNRNDFNNCYSPRVEKPGNRKRKANQREGQLLPTKISKTTLNDKIQNSKQLPTNGIGSSSEIFTDSHAHQPSDREISEPLDNDRLNKIPVNAVKPHPSAPVYSQPLSTSSLLKASVLQQQARQELAASGGQYRPRSPRCSLQSPQTPKQEVVVKQTATQAQSEPRLSSPTLRPGSVDTSGLGPSPQALNVCVQGLHTDGLGSADLDSQSRTPNTSLHNSTASPCSDGVSLEDDGAVGNTGKRKRQKYRPKDYVVNLDGQTVVDSTKPVRLKDRRLTFDPVTGQIKTSFHKESCQEGEVRLGHRPEPQWSDQPKQNPSVPPSPFQQTDWKELSRSEIIQSYLSQQSNVLTSSGAHTPGAHFFMTEFLKKEEHQSKDTKETHVLAPERSAKDLPGVSREVNNEDLSRLHAQHWSGVNGCYDTKGNWYDWTECISLDPHGDESRLNILPYVCLD